MLEPPAAAPAEEPNFTKSLVDWFQATTAYSPLDMFTPVVAAPFTVTAKPPVVLLRTTYARLFVGTVIVRIVDREPEHESILYWADVVPKLDAEAVPWVDVSVTLASVVRDNVPEIAESRYVVTELLTTLPHTPLSVPVTG